MPDDNKAQENFDRYVYARDTGHREYVRKADKCEQFFFGNQWDEDVQATLEAVNKPVLTLNKVFANMMTASGEHLANTADVAFRPTSSGNMQTADALTKFYIAWSQAVDLEWIEQRLFSAGAITGRGWVDMRINFDQNMKGEITLKPIKGRNVVVDPDADTYDPDDWKEVFLTRWLTPNDIRRIYPDKAKEAESLELREESRLAYLGYDSIDHLTNTFGRTLTIGPTALHEAKPDKKVRRFIRVIQRQYKDWKQMPHFVNKITGEMRVIPDAWKPEKIKQAVQDFDLAIINKKVEMFKWIDTADDLVLFEKDQSSYKHFTVIPYFPVFYEGQTIGLVENLLSPQELLNKTESQELHIVNTTANSGWKLKQGSLLNMEEEELEARGAETGLVMVLDDINSAEKITPNPVPTGLDRIAFKAGEHLKDIMGISDSQRGFDRADVAAKAIRAKQAAGSINLAIPFRNMVQTRHMIAKRWLDLAQSYITEERVVSYITNIHTNELEEVRLNYAHAGQIVNDLTMGEYSVVVTDVPRRITWEDQQFDEVMRMREAGIPIPEQFLIENSHLQKKSEIIQALSGEEQQEQQQALLQLEFQMKQVEMQKAQAEAMLKKAQATKTLVEAQNETIESVQNTPENDGNSIEEQKIVNDLQIKIEELNLEKQRLEQEAVLEREKIAADMKMKELELQTKSLIEHRKVTESAKARQNEPKT